MTLKEYQKKIKEVWDSIDQNNLAEVHAYNIWRKKLRKEVEENNEQQVS